MFLAKKACRAAHALNETLCPESHYPDQYPVYYDALYFPGATKPEAEVTVAEIG